MGALPAHLERMRSHPDIAGEVLRLEYTAMSLNPNAKLYGRKTLLEMFDRSRPRDRACLEAFERELEMPWALYHVRRLFLLSDSGKRRPVMRSTERVDLGRPQQLARRLGPPWPRCRRAGHGRGSRQAAGDARGRRPGCPGHIQDRAQRPYQQRGHDGRVHDRDAVLAVRVSSLVPRKSDMTAAGSSHGGMTSRSCSGR